MTRKPTLILLLLCMLQLAACAQQTHQLDTKKSTLKWSTPIGGHKGYLLFNSGSLLYSTAGQPLSGSFIMDMKSMQNTDDRPEKNKQETDAKLRTPDFFAVDTYPTSTIIVKKISRIAASNTYRVGGDLTIKGITQPIEFTATIDKKDNTTHITADIGILRHLWNIDFKPSNSVELITGLSGKVDGDDIYVALDLTLVK